MRSLFWAAAGTAFTFLMTTLGAALVFFFKKNIKDSTQRACLGFAGGVMSAAAVFSLIEPAIEQTEQMGGVPWLCAAVYVSLGAAAIAGVDALMRKTKRMQKAGDDARRRALMFTAITLHNIPEGMAVGLAFALAAQNGGLAAAAALALGIGIQNFPEGAAVSLPLRQGGMSRWKSFVYGTLSGIVEPIFGILVVLAVNAAQPIMPPLMAFSAGAMMHVVAAEMIPEAAKDRKGVFFTMAGYVLMMTLDVALG